MANVIVFGAEVNWWRPSPSEAALSAAAARARCEFAPSSRRRARPPSAPRPPGRRRVVAEAAGAARLGRDPALEHADRDPPHARQGRSRPARRRTGRARLWLVVEPSSSARCCRPSPPSARDWTPGAAAERVDLDSGVLAGHPRVGRSDRAAVQRLAPRVLVVGRRRPPADSRRRRGARSSSPAAPRRALPACARSASRGRASVAASVPPRPGESSATARARASAAPGRSAPRSRAAGRHGAAPAGRPARSSESSTSRRGASSSSSTTMWRHALRQRKPFHPLQRPQG